MSIVKVIGFIITMLSIIFTFFKQRYGAPHPKKRETVQLIKEEEEDRLGDFLTAYSLRLKMPAPKAPPQYIYKDDLHWKAPATPDKIKVPLDDHYQVSKRTISHEKRNIGLHPPFEEGYTSRAKAVLHQLSQPSDMIICQEILAKPKSLRSDEWL